MWPHLLVSARSVCCPLAVHYGTVTALLVMWVNEPSQNSQAPLESSDDAYTVKRIMGRSGLDDSGDLLIESPIIL